MAYDEPALRRWTHWPEAIQAYRRGLEEETPQRIGMEVRRALLEELPTLWTGEAAQGYLEEAQRRLEIFQRWLVEGQHLSRAIAAGEERIAQVVAEVEQMLRSLPDPTL
ncbi:hypothetical protein [Thermoflexus hugenholtzii]